MSSGSPPTEGMLAKGGLRYLRNETEDMSEGNFFGRKVERVSISSGTARAGSIFVIGTNAASNALIGGHGGVWIKVIPAQPPMTLAIGNEYPAHSTVTEIMGGSGAVPARAQDYATNWPNVLTVWTGGSSEISSAGTSLHIRPYSQVGQA